MIAVLSDVPAMVVKWNLAPQYCATHHSENAALRIPGLCDKWCKQDIVQAYVSLGLESIRLYAGLVQPGAVHSSVYPHALRPREPRVALAEVLQEPAKLWKNGERGSIGVCARSEACVWLGSRVVAENRGRLIGVSNPACTFCGVGVVR